MRPMILAAVVLACTSAPLPHAFASGNGDPLSRPSAVSGELRDARGRRLLLRGINLSERSKKPPFTGWLTPAHTDTLVRLGFDHVRFLITWDAVEPQDGVFDDAYLDAMLVELSWLEARGIYAVVDMHQDMFSRRFGGDGFPDWMLLRPDPFPFLPDVLAPFPINYASPKVLANFDAFYRSPAKRARLARAWAHVVHRLKRAPNVIGWDLLNEPFPGPRLPWEFEARELSTLEAELVLAIRAEDRERIIFFEPVPTAVDLPLDFVKRPRDANVVYAPHWYDPIINARGALGLTGFYAGDRAYIARGCANAASQARALGCALWIGEWGWVDRRAPSATAEYLRDTCDVLDRDLLSACFWDFDPVEDDVCSIVDGRGRELPFAAALARPHPRATAGTLTKLAFDPLARELRMEWDEGNLGPAAPTLIELPWRVFPKNATLAVTLGEPAARWERDPATGRLAVWADPTLAHHALSVR